MHSYECPYCSESLFVWCFSVAIFPRLIPPPPPNRVSAQCRQTPRPPLFKWCWHFCHCVSLSHAAPNILGFIQRRTIKAWALHCWVLTALHTALLSAHCIAYCTAQCALHCSLHCSVLTVLYCTLHCSLHTSLLSAHCIAHCTAQYSLHCILHCTAQCSLHCTAHCTAHQPILQTTRHFRNLNTSCYIEK